MKLSTTLLTAYAALLLGALSPNALAADYRVGERLAQPKATAAGKYTEIQWDDLIPKDWDPMAEFKKMDFAKLKDGDPRATEALEKLRASWDAAPIEPAITGKPIRLAGFVIPLERKGDVVSELLLVPYFGACIHTPPPPANQAIHVILSKPVSKLKMMDAFWVSGKLETFRGNSGLGVYGYRMRSEGLERYPLPR